MIKYLILKNKLYKEYKRMNKKIDCLKCEKQYYGEHEGMRVKTFIDTRTLPIVFINAEYGNIDNFIESENGRIFEADSYKIEKSADYDYNKYKKYIDSENDKILKI